MITQENISNFNFLSDIDPLFFQLAKNAELTFVSDPNTSLIKVRQLGEAMTQYIMDSCDIEKSDRSTQTDAIYLIDKEIGLDSKIRDLLHLIRKLGNKANHEFVTDHGEALKGLQAVHAVAIWFHDAFNKSAKDKIIRKKFIAPRDPSEHYQAVLIEKERLARELAKSRDDQSLKEQLHIKEQELQHEQSLLQQEMMQQAEENSALIQLYEEELHTLEKDYESRVAVLQNLAQQADKKALLKKLQKVDDNFLSEALTRELIIDKQLQDAGWEAESKLLRYSKGTRPEAHRNLAIAEWPMKNGDSADYVLFAGLIPIAVVEAKKRNEDVAGKIGQAERYSINFTMNEFVPAYTVDGHHKPWCDGDNSYEIPFVYSSNGRPYVKQLPEKSGTWFRDVRKPSNIRKALQSFHSPNGLLDLLKRDHERSVEQLQNEGMNYLKLRYYQENAIYAVENAINQSQTNILVAMATGTGKTRTILGLAYRLLKSERFKRILFLVDRSALGEQTEDVMKEFTLEQNQTFSSIYTIADLKVRKADDAVRVQVATVQAMVNRLFIDNDNTISIDEYDCIIVDEAHRGYTLDQEMTEEELLYRDEKQYQSTYRRVLDYFDATKIALTATPAKHTVDIFGKPVFTYSYREAVIDGYLIDHDPPKRYITILNSKGISFEKGDAVESVDRFTGELNTIELEDELNFEVDAFNKQVIAPDFNRVICEDLAKNDLDPFGTEKTLIFCVTDEHADTVKRLLDENFSEIYGDEYNEKSVMKITGKSDKVKELIRLFKNERYPNIAITVDLLSTGIDVPSICNIVFLRKVKSRILYEQMIGRATRKCDEIGKVSFKIYDPVDLYATLQEVSTMKPIVKNPNVTMEELSNELLSLCFSKDDNSITMDEQYLKHTENVLAEFNQKVIRVLKKADKKAEKQTEIREKLDVLQEMWGVEPKVLNQHFHKIGATKTAEFLVKHPNFLNELESMRRMISDEYNPIYANHEDEITTIEYNYGEYDRPEDYLDSFKDFVLEHSNINSALSIVINRPSDLTRHDLKEIKEILDAKGYTEHYLKNAWRAQTNEEITASIIGFIRQAALGEAMISFDDRVRKAMRAVHKLHAWTPVQKRWLERIEKQLINEIILDRDRISEIFAKDGGSQRLDNHLNNHLDEVLESIHTHLWMA